MYQSESALEHNTHHIRPTNTYVPVTAANGRSCFLLVVLAVLVLPALPPHCSLTIDTFFELVEPEDCAPVVSNFACDFSEDLPLASLMMATVVPLALLAAFCARWAS